MACAVGMCFKASGVICTLLTWELVALSSCVDGV